MKSTLKHLAATAAFVTATAASATPIYDWSQNWGSANWTVSADGLFSLASNATAIRTPPVIPASSGLSQAGIFNPANYSKVTGTLNLPFTQGNVTGDSLTAFQSENAFVDFRRLVFTDDDTIIAYSVFMTDWKVDVTTATVYAKLYSLSDATGTRSLGEVAVFTVASPSLTSWGTQGQVVVDAVDEKGQATGHISGAFQGGLHMDAQAANLILTGLNISTAEDFVPAKLFRGIDWGQLSYSAILTGTPAVPEPSDFALVGAGMFALLTSKRLRLKA